MVKSKKLLVIGGAGYIGSHVVQLLCDEGYSVSVFDNFSLGLQENIDPRVAEVIKGDILNNNNLNATLNKDYDVVFHFAAWKAAGESMTDPIKYAKNNISGTINLIEAMLKHNTKYIVFSSSAAVYGNPEYLPIDENHPVDPTNFYGYTKLAIEQNLNWFSNLKNIRFSALRYFNATGYDINGKIRGKEKDPANLSPIVMEVAAGTRENMLVFGDDYKTKDGTCIRDYIHVTDLATAHLLAMRYIVDENKDLVVNLGTGIGYSVMEVIAAAEKVTNQKIDYQIVGRRKGDPEELVASSEKAKNILSWKAQHSDLETIFNSMKPVYLKK